MRLALLVLTGLIVAEPHLAVAADPAPKPERIRKTDAEATVVSGEFYTPRPS